MAPVITCLTTALALAFSRSGSISISVKGWVRHGTRGVGSMVSRAYRRLRSIVRIISTRGNRWPLPICELRAIARTITPWIGWFPSNVLRRAAIIYARCLSRKWISNMWNSTSSASVDTVLKAERIWIRAILWTVFRSLRCVLSLSRLCQTVDI